ncbi:MAG: LysR family transcriptional regulator [Sulfobacillus sp.]
MEYRALKYFLAISDFGNMTRAAQAMHVSQPALSQSIQSLERQVGHPLFHRTASGVELTEDGKLLRFHALRIVHAMEDAEQELGTGHHRETDLRVGVLPTLAHDYVPAILRQLVDSTPSPPTIKLVESHTQGLVKQVLTGALHLAILDLPISEPAVNVATLWRERLVIVASPSLHLASPLPWHQLVHTPFITMEPGYGLRDVLFQIALANGFQPQIVFELTSFNALLGFVRAGFGVALIPHRSVQLEISNHRVELVIPTPETTRDIGVIWRAGRRLPDHAAQFKDLLINSARDISEHEAKSSSPDRE